MNHTLDDLHGLREIRQLHYERQGEKYAIPADTLMALMTLLGDLSLRIEVLHQENVRLRQHLNPKADA